MMFIVENKIVIDKCIHFVMLAISIAMIFTMSVHDCLSR
uniref:Uncharacterized protein n=1 Tax=Arundo donax TaxID=35708 RepID=A0A0A9FND6_ARUDO